MKKIYLTTLILLAIVCFAPHTTKAAVVYLESSRSTAAVGDTIIVTAKINAEGTTINTVEGDIAAKSGGTSVAVDEFSLANSAFGLWPRTPSLSKDGQVVSFVGGVPGGFNIEGATLFKIVYKVQKEGEAVIAPQNIIAFANDGKGTKVPVTMKGLTLKVAAAKEGVAAVDDWRTIVSQDTAAPEDFIIVLGQENSLFNGKKFAFFSALDNQSGISYYEVSENGAAPIRTGSTYVLQTQTGNVKLVVTAYDKAGNKKEAKYSGPVEPRPGNFWTWLIATVIIVVVVAVILRKKTKKTPVANGPLQL